jgi:hypothetical protein
MAISPLSSLKNTKSEKVPPVSTVTRYLDMVRFVYHGIFAPSITRPKLNGAAPARHALASAREIGARSRAAPCACSESDLQLGSSSWPRRNGGAIDHRAGNQFSRSVSDALWLN